MKTDFPVESEKFIRRQVDSGAFPDRESVLRAGIVLLQQRTELLDRLAEGRRQLDEGEYIEYDEAGLDQLFGRLNQRVSTVF
jgi:Arc/MetJ-type ribon-helix-helix transcriptional regulator